MKRALAALFAGSLWTLVAAGTVPVDPPPVDLPPVDLPRTAPVPGGVAVVPLGPLTRPVSAVRYGKRPVMLRRDGEQWVAVVGIPLAAKVGEHHLDVTVDGRVRRVSFRVRPMQYAEQRLTIRNRRMVEPTQKDLERIWREKKIIGRSFATFSPAPPPSLRFIPPVDGRYSSPFGLRRFFNGKPRKPHSGLDIAAPEGTPIRAPAPGVVLTTGNYFFNGNTVFLDHGNGLVSMFCHMNRIDVKPGQRLARGAVLGRVGKTGRVTGPHLHWSVSLNNTRVDPGLFLSAPPVKGAPTPPVAE